MGDHRTRVALNARFRDRAVTGVERVATELAARLPAALGSAVTELRPGRPQRGPRGHLWEQTVLPGRFRRSSAELLISLCNVGPTSVSDQLVLVHDVAPFRHPDLFTPAYGVQVRAVQRRLARRCRLATVSEHSRRELAGVLQLDPATIAVVPPAVAAPFTPDGPREQGDYAVFVGGHDARKNLALLLDIWPAVHRASGLELRIVSRSSTTTLRGGAGATAADGVRWSFDLDDAGLARLYRGARLVLAPSRYEGFGLPLLEGMACGTPFLASDTGAAAELAVDPRQLVPLDHGSWRDAVIAAAGADLGRLAAASAAAARRWTWERSAAALAEAARGAVRRPPPELAATARRSAAA